MSDNETENNEEYYSPLDALEEDNYDDSDYESDDDYLYLESDERIIDCSNCNHSWDLADSSPNDAYVCHLCGIDNSYEDDESSNFDDSVFNMDFSDIRGNYKQSFGRVNRKIDSDPRRRRNRIRKPRQSVQGVNRSEAGKYQGRQSRPRISKRPLGGGMAKPMGEINPNGIAKPMGKTNLNGIAKPVMKPNPKGISKPTSTPFFQSSVGKRSKNNLLKGDLKNNLKKPIKVSLADDKKVIIKGASNFILSQKSKDEGIKNIQYYKGKKLKPLVIIITNNDPTDFDFELFNPSMPLDYLFSTSQNLNNRISIAGSQTSYSDMLFNILANPTMLINAQITTAGTQVANQNNQAIFVKNKNIEGVEKVFPVNIDLQVDNMQVAKDIIYFNVFTAINRPFIPDGMDIMQYKVLSGMTVNLTFWYTQVSLKKFFYEEARASKTLL